MWVVLCCRYASWLVSGLPGVAAVSALCDFHAPCGNGNMSQCLVLSIQEVNQTSARHANLASGTHS